MPKLNALKSYQTIEKLYHKRGWKPFPFQEEIWSAFLNGESGLLNAPTGSGKTLALWIPCLMEYMDKVSDYQQPKKNGLKILWITPLRALTKDTHRAMEETCTALEVAWRVDKRTGDTSSSARAKQQRNMPECLITTPESLHLMLALKSYEQVFKNLEAVIVDEWHELLGTKRGIQVELGLSRLRSLRPNLRTWGVSATIGNLAEAAKSLVPHREPVIIRAKRKKKTQVVSILPDSVERFPWSGHLGVRMVEKVLPIIEESATTLLFTNTRAMTEIWYQRLLEVAPWLAGQMAMHHGSLDREVREWVEEAIHKGILKLVVCTSSLDLGVDFRPVETVIQVGSPKGVARFLQRAGRSGHQPDAVSKIFFLPTHSLELVEAAALQEAVQKVTEEDKVELIESRPLLDKPIDVLVQYLVTLAVSGGFSGAEILYEVKNTLAYETLTNEEWKWALQFITTGGQSLDAYDEYNKVEMEGEDFYVVNSRRIAMRHRLSMGTIVSEPVVNLKLVRGGYIGTVEEYFISRLNIGDAFFFAGRNLELVELKGLNAKVKPSKKKKGHVPRWTGARMLLSSQLADLIIHKIANYRSDKSIEMRTIFPLMELQNQWSAIPQPNQLLIEKMKSDEGYHVFFYPFEGREIHELLAGVIAWRISQMQPITFSMAMNDYGFELLSDTEIPLEYALEEGLFSSDDLISDLSRSINNSEMAKRRFREIAAIAGLLFQGYPGKAVKTRHLQASTKLLFEVFVEYEPNNLLIKQAYDEVMGQQMGKDRVKKAFDNMTSKEIIITHPPKPSPFSFPILVDRLRDQISSETVEDRVAKMQLELEMYAEEGI